MTLVSAYASELLEPMRPDPITWARQLDLPARESATSPGRYYPEPYQAEIIRANTSRDVSSVTACIGTQGGKSLSFAISLLYLLDVDPGNVLIGTATQDMAKSLGRERLQSIIDENPVLARHKPADVDLYKVQEMSFDRATWVLTGTQSSNGVISRPCRYTWIDEAQRAGIGIIAEAEQRTKTFPHTHKHLRSGTPTTPENDLWRLYLKGTCEHWHHACPHCGGEFAFQNYADDRTGSSDQPPAGLTWSPEAKVDGQWNEERVRATAHYLCPHCAQAITEDQRLPMVRAGRFVVTNPNANPANRSFWVPSLCTRDVTFGEMAVQFLRALSDFFGFREFLNGYWALPFSASAAAVSDAAVDACRGTHRTGEIPFEPTHLTLSSDVADAMTHWEVAAHGPEGELAVIDSGTVLAPEDVLAQLDRTYPAPSGKTWRVTFGLIDSGHQAHRVYRICARS
jgi:phage terminase large subunit GpA-like protein